jgi:FMN phosphatase YigB (HAD superfamily)
MSTTLAFLFDVDNTLVDNDAAKNDLAAGVEQTVGGEHAARFWQIYEEVRHEREYVDYLRTLAHFRAEAPHEPGRHRRSAR